jgi:hypothetical protein
MSALFAYFDAMDFDLKWAVHGMELVGIHDFGEVDGTACFDEVLSFPHDDMSLLGGEQVMLLHEYVEVNVVSHFLSEFAIKPYGFDTGFSEGEGLHSGG